MIWPFEKSEPKPEPKSSFEKGYDAFVEGKDFCENPEAHPHGSVREMTAWFAGWCQAKQKAREEA